MFKEQNIYDNEQFFCGYKKLRSNEMSANNVEEKPALFAMMPSLKGKSVLDLGCGFGENCRSFAELGASYVLGIDISKKMLSVASRENKLPNVEFKELSMNNLSELTSKFDVVISSLAFHYIEDFQHLVSSIKGVMNKNGVLLFSQEHPIATAPMNGIKWKNNGDYVIGMILTDYQSEGERKIHWIVDDVVKYHRKTSTILNTLIEQKFTILSVEEPTVSKAIIEKEPCLSRCEHAPDYLFVKAQLTGR